MCGWGCGVSYQRDIIRGRKGAILQVMHTYAPPLEFVWPLEVSVAGDPFVFRLYDGRGCRILSKTTWALKIGTKDDNLSGLWFCVECEKLARAEGKAVMCHLDPYSPIKVEWRRANLSFRVVNLEMWLLCEEGIILTKVMLIFLQVFLFTHAPTPAAYLCIKHILHTNTVPLCVISL